MLIESIVNGYYGKVPTHGDFVSRGLPASFIDPWDAWLQEAVITSRRQLGNNWLDSYLTSPIYRFVLSPGICGEHSWLGILMPSVDRVGRYYPMTIGLLNQHNINPFLAMQREVTWFTNAETLALSSLADNFNLQEFNDQLSRLSPEILNDNCVNGFDEEPSERQPSHHAWQQTFGNKQNICDVLPCFLDTQLKEQFFAYSVWWTQGSERVAPSLLICEGLPPFDGMAAMFDGNWKKWGWEGNRYPSLPFGNQGNNQRNA
ncbi:type VI secretion system-associated protein TagF [Methylomarinum vadi]|uniref:type VI secretion system-associated protein TagF n=1 Tax=Methylomarinum vadi TaxID=438855 RepID=UPI000690549E|nr:type VI secretion system-associated protein TagF [Methylomarinum vadi]